MSFTYEQLAQVAFKIISLAGEAKSEAMLAIYDAKKNLFKKATQRIAVANKNINNASMQHCDLIQKEAQGEKVDVPLILLHAEDILLSTQSLILLAQEIIDLHQNVWQLSQNLKPK